MTQNISWDQYFMSLAILISLRSKDPSSKVGAVLVRENKIIGTGYNGFPTGCDESQFPWERDVDGEGWLNTKYPYVIHAEANALLNTVTESNGCEIFVTLHPCNECAKLMIQGGVKRVTYLSDKHKGVDAFVAARKLLEVTGVEVRKMDAGDLNLPLIVDNFKTYS
jgi:dCMP deaminase